MKCKPTHNDLAQLYNQATGAKSFFKGTSFRCNKGTPNTRYFHNDQYIDFVICDHSLLLCLRDHISSEQNRPDIQNINNEYVLVDTPIWELVMSEFDPVEALPAGGSAGQILTKKSNTDHDVEGSDAPEQGITNITASVNSVTDSDITRVNVQTVPITARSTQENIVGYDLQFDFELQKGKDGKDGKDGAQGIDGNGIDYIFLLNNSPELESTLDPSFLDAVQNDDYYPEGGTPYAQQVTTTQMYQGVSSRRKTAGIGSKFSEPIILNNYNQEGIAGEVSFTSFVFCKTSKTGTDTDTKPSGGSYENPFPVNFGTIGGETIEGVDSIPVGTGQVGMSSATFTNNSEEVTGSTPVPMSDTNDFQVEYSSAEHPANPESLQSYYDSDSTKYETLWRQNNPDGTDQGEDAIGMATCKMHNGVGGDGSINKIKGEDGNDGTSVTIKEGNYTSESDLPENANIGDCYLIDGNLGAGDGDSWVNAGNIKGDNGTNGKDGVDGKDGINGTDGKDGAPGADGKDGNDGLSAGVHVKYANSKPANDYVFDENNIGSGFTESNGETPGPYIGIYADHNEDDSLDPTKYKGTKGQGEDGGGYEYIYQRTSKYEAPELPISENSDNYIPGDGSDDPMDVSTDYPYGWMCYRVKQNGTGSEFKGSKENPGYASLWAKYGEKGDDGRSIVSVTEYYLLSEKTTGITADSEGGSTEISSPTDGKHLWNYETIKYSDNTESSTTPVIIAYYTENGKDGVSITNIKEEYALSTSSTEVTGDWNEAIPTMDPINCYLWNRETIAYSDNTETVLDPVIIGVHGQDGTSFTIAGQYETVEGLKEAYNNEFESGKSWKESTAGIIGNRYYYIFQGEWIELNDDNIENIFYIIDAKGDPAGRSITKFIFKSSETNPGQPIGGTYNFTNGTFDAPEGGSVSDANLVHPIGMSSRLFAESNKGDNAGSIPILISGANGESGIDGKSFEYAYKRMTSEDVPTDTPGENKENDNYGNEGYDHPQGVDITYICEYVSVRSGSSDNGSDGSAPVLGSKYGVDGRDGSDIEYLYYVNNTGITPYNPTPENYTTGEYQLPEGKPSANEYNNIAGIVITDGDNWKDNPITVDKLHKYEYVSVRKKSAGVGDTFSDPTLGATFSEDGADGAGVEYVYAISSIDSTEFSLSSLSLPNNDGGYDNPETPGTDNPTGVSSSNPVEWVCCRIKPQGSAQWNEGSTPSVFSRFGKTGDPGAKGDTGAPGPVSVLVTLYTRTYTPDNDYTIPVVTVTLTENNNVVIDYDDPENAGFTTIPEQNGNDCYSINTQAIFNENSITIAQNAGSDLIKLQEPGKGAEGKIMYPVGKGNAETSYQATETTAPYVYYEPDKTYYVWASILPSEIGTVPSESTGGTTLDMFNAIGTNVLMADYAMLGDAVFYKNYMFSQKGLLYKIYYRRSTSSSSGYIVASEISNSYTYFTKQAIANMTATMNNPIYQDITSYDNGTDIEFLLTIPTAVNSDDTLDTFENGIPAFKPYILFDFATGNGGFGGGKILFKDGEIVTKNVHTVYDQATYLGDTGVSGTLNKNYLVDSLYKMCLDPKLSVGYSNSIIHLAINDSSLKVGVGYKGTIVVNVNDTLNIPYSKYIGSGLSSYTYDADRTFLDYMFYWDGDTGVHTVQIDGDTLEFPYQTGILIIN